MPKMPTLLEMLQAGVHFGHQANRWHPKMEPFIFGVRGGVHIINLEKTQQMLAQACEFAKDLAAKGGVVLFVATKRQAQAAVKEAAQSCGMPYITERWLGGLLTNFAEIHRLVERFREMKHQRETGGLEKYTKKERANFDKEIEGFEQVLSGVEHMDKMPDAIFIVDVRHEKTVRAEASVVGLPVIAICDSNVNPTHVDHVIPANDDAVRSIALIATALAAAVNEGKKEAPAPKVPISPVSAKKPVTPRPAQKVANPV